jgi:hypothetical protein
MVFVVIELFVGISLLSHGQKASPVIVLQKPYTPPFDLRNWIGRWIPRSPGWSWAFRLEDLIFGKRKLVSISTQFLKFPDPLSWEMSDFKLKAPELFNSGGLRV